MNIIMLCDFFNNSLEYQENLLVKYYEKHGHKVTVISSTFESIFDYYNDRHDNKVSSSISFIGTTTVHKLRYRYNILNRLRAYTTITPILETAQPDLIYVHDIMLNFPEAIRYMKRHPHCRMIMDYHADYSNSGKNWLSLKILHGVLRKWFLNRARPHLSRIFPVVPAGATFLNEIYNVPFDEMEVLPLGADTDLANAIAAENQRTERRAVLGFNADDIVIFTGGKLTPLKRTEYLFDAVAKRADPRIKIVVVGKASEADSDYAIALNDRATLLGGVHFMGWLGREDVYRHLDIADLAVFPASQSVLWQQSIAMGLPLIVGDMGHQDVSYLNLHDNIIMLPTTDIRPESIADAIKSVIIDRSRLDAMKEGARRVADEHLNWNRLIARTLQFNA